MLQLWDLSGQEKFANFRTKFYSGASSAIVVLSKTDLDSVSNLKKWVEEFSSFTKSATLVVLGNKSDLDSTVSKEIIDGALSNILVDSQDYFDVSAKTGLNVENAFKRIVYRTLEAYNQIKA